MYDYYFDESLCHKGFYVYIFMTPDREIFYVGKGSRYRCFNHFSSSSLKRLSLKNNKIKSIIDKGQKVLIDLVCFGLENEDTAFEVEESLIKVYGLKSEGGSLTNAIHHRGGHTTYSKSSQNPSEKGIQTKLERYTEEERAEWYKKGNTPQSKVKKSRASKRAWANWTEEERNKHIHKLYENGAITDYKYWYSADLVYLLWKEYGDIGRFKLAFVFMDYENSKPFESMVCGFKKGWNPFEDKGFCDLLKSHKKERALVESFDLHPLAKAYFTNHINSKTRLFIDEQGNFSIGREAMCKAAGVTCYKYRRNQNYYNSSLFKSLGERLLEIDKLILEVRYKDGTCSPLLT